MPRGKFLWLTSLLTALPLAASTRTAIQPPSASNVIHEPAANAFASDTFYFVDICEQLSEFAKLSLELDNGTDFHLPEENVVDANVYWRAFNLANLFLPVMHTTLTGLQESYETFMCAFVSSAFTTTVMDRNGDAWLFSDAFDNNLAALDRAIAREFDAAYHSTRFHCFVYYEPLLPVFDKFYKRCVGDKLEALYSVQVN